MLIASSNFIVIGKMKCL